MIYTFTSEPGTGAVERLQRDSLAIWRELGARRDLAYSLFALGMHYLSVRTPARAEPLVREALTIGVELGDTFGITFELAIESALAAAQGRAEQAVRLDGAVATLCEATGLRIFPPIQALIDRELPAARAALGPVSTAAAFAAGRALMLEQAVAEVLTEAESAG